ncbi:hypothetical protein [Desulfoplanes sp.]
MSSRRKKKKNVSTPRRCKMDRQQRLESARSTRWLEKYGGKNPVKGYRKAFGVDILCAVAELKMLGMTVSKEYEERLETTVKNRIEAKRRKRARREEEEKQILGLDQDEYFGFIAGYTLGGASYGVTWEEMEQMEKSEEMGAKDIANNAKNKKPSLIIVPEGENAPF